VFILEIISWDSVLIQAGDPSVGCLWFPSGCTALEEEVCVSVNTDQSGVALRRAGKVVFRVMRFRSPATWVLSRTSPTLVIYSFP